MTVMSTAMSGSSSTVPCQGSLPRTTRSASLPTSSVLNVLNALKQVPEVCRIYCATANPVEVVVAETDQGRVILGVVDGSSPLGVEDEGEASERKELLRRFGYKL